MCENLHTVYEMSLPCFFVQSGITIRLLVCIQNRLQGIRSGQQIRRPNMHLTYLFALPVISILLSVVVCDNCGYVRGPLAATNDTVVIKLDCRQSESLSHNVPLQLRDSVTHVAVQLAHCHTVPVGLFTNCLLYTSPSPRDGLLSRMPSSA